MPSAHYTAHVRAGKKPSADCPVCASGGKHGLKRALAGAHLAASSSPYWATPQCVLKRHLLAQLPDVRMVDCLREVGQRPLLRLVRPT